MVTRVDWLLTLGLFIVSISLRLWGIMDPSTTYFDEVYYVDAANSILNGEGDPNWVHPPLGKLLIAVGILAYGNNPLGWRLMPSISGSCCVSLVYLLSLILLRSRAQAFLTGLSLMLDPLSFVQSRMAMLDIFLPLFSLLACLFFVNALNDGWKRTVWLALSGGAIGAGVSVKWSLFPMLLLLAGLAFFATCEREVGFTGRLWKVYLSYVLLPTLVYLLSYLLVFVGKGTPLDWLGLQGGMLNYHLTLKETHPDSIHPLFWWVGRHLYYIDYTTCAEIWAKSNPFTWLPAAAASVYTGYRWLRNRQPSQMLPTLVFAVEYFLWFLSPRIVFLFYMLPILPFLYISLGYFLVNVANKGKFWRLLVPAYAIAVCIMFITDYPSLTGLAYP